MRTARVFAVAWVMHLKMLSRSAFDGVLGVLWPLFFATLAFLMYGVDGGEAALLYVAVGASVMGIWSSVSTAASSAVQRERWAGTLELLVAAPVRLPVVLLPITTAMATVGLYSMTATLLWGRFLFGIDVSIRHPWLFAVAVVATVLSIGMLGFLMAVTVVRYRSAWALGTMFEEPVWLVCGFLVPVAILPGWVEPLSWLLAPTWGVRAIREAALGGSPLPDVALCLGVGFAYAAIGFYFAETILTSARRTASLAIS